jgi:hypothetical protein
VEAAVGTIAGAGWASGVNLYAVVALLHLFGRSGAIEVPELLQRTDVLVVAVVLYLLEFVADKVPYLDNVWDVVHTVVRPVGAAAVGAALAGDAVPLDQALSAAGAGGLAFLSHATKATTRAAINTSPEPASNIVVSLLEDGLVAGVVALAVWNPVVAAAAVVVLLLAGAVLLVVLWRTARRAFGTVRERLGRRTRPG